VPNKRRRESKLIHAIVKIYNIIMSTVGKGPFKYYVIKEVGRWGQKMAIFDDLQYCKSSKRWVAGPKKVKNMMTKYLNGP
jgi:hypothetical protein